jgi:Ca2+-binding EF-hand superfamily protein
VIRQTTFLLSLAACGIALAAPTAAPKHPPRTGTLELVVLAEDRLARLEILVEVDGKSVASVWDTTFGRMLAYYDRNRDGHLDKTEAARLPSPFGIRQILWGQSSPYSGPAVPWKQLDADGDEKVTRAELAGFYRRTGLGNATVGFGSPPSTKALTVALLKALDTDGDGTVSEAEWKTSAKTLSKFDRNDDELIGPGELVPLIAYPGASGTTLSRPPAPNDRKFPALTGVPVVLLPGDPADQQWATVVVSRRDTDRDGKLSAEEAGLPEASFASLDADRDGKLTPAELAGLRKLAPFGRYKFELGRSPSVKTAEGPFSTKLLKLSMRAGQGKMPNAVAVSRKRMIDRFADTDADGDGLLEAKEITNRNGYDLKLLLKIADLDGDGKLSKSELVAWLDLQDQIASGHALVTILDHGAGLFELLDANHDGSLSVPELRQAWGRVKDAGCVSQGKFLEAALPRHLSLTASRGHPVNPLSSVRPRGPAWFRAMDRNGDGYVSRREFTGTGKLFEKFDLDRDGFLSPEEAAKIQNPTQ